MDDRFEKIEEIEYTYNENFSLTKDSAVFSSRPPTARSSRERARGSAAHTPQSIAAIANALRKHPSSGPLAGTATPPAGLDISGRSFTSTPDFLVDDDNNNNNSSDRKRLDRKDGPTSRPLSRFSAGRIFVRKRSQPMSIQGGSAFGAFRTKSLATGGTGPASRQLARQESS
mmetsp:Transcript_13821/g.29909  ORF Transcript_13821/g.29909 Transcript_13821/m.29909 type:complete len:172 (+) Transcript_13821:125-640(+)|eukprot:CAMPEP_0185848016 /NCGR_PEP_ID=MMETSP1354-20130828/3049_1 /TAXON_ID=708628 /ORGANISM="Erythrolobus madagascarensis, Strain CCMP3276" /LENGTH=171 /DNA_ID=CAMNT_0028548359 /DNA_START=73 /DNA_END=588 /DNA_ORIENTATION=-